MPDDQLGRLAVGRENGNRHGGRVGWDLEPLEERGRDVVRLFRSDQLSQARGHADGPAHSFSVLLEAVDVSPAPSGLRRGGTGYRARRSASADAASARCTT